MCILETVCINMLLYDILIREILYSFRKDGSIHSENLYQIFAYVKNLDKNNTGFVSGILLYGKTQEAIVPNSRYSMGGNTIWVRTLDLNLPFMLIASQLEKKQKIVLK